MNQPLKRSFLVVWLLISHWFGQLRVLFWQPNKSDSGSGVKRASDQSAEDQPAPKKSNVPSSIRELAEGETRETFPIPDQLVGLVIGRGGENIQRVQSTTKCEIQVLPSPDGSNDRPCTLTGMPEAVAEAKKMLQETIANGQAKDDENRKTPRGVGTRGGMAGRGRGGPMRGGYNPGVPRFQPGVDISFLVFSVFSKVRLLNPV